MGEGCRRRRRRSHGSIDHISSLPDHLLHCILLRLRSTRAAARTSVLSRRWRRVWAHLPALRLGTCDCDDLPGATRLDSVDAALAACSSPAVQRLEVAMYCHGLRVQARRVAPWLRFASQRRVGELYIYMPPQTKFFLLTREAATEEEEELQLPVWDEATTITLSLERRWRLRLPATGLFVALTDLQISLVTMEASELGALVSTQCPRLRNLYLFLTLAAAASNVVSIRSDSLHSLSFHGEKAQRLQVICPKLEVLTLSDAIGTHISAPKLAEVTWDGDTGYDPRCHCFVDAGRHLRLLDLGSNCLAASLMQRFDEVDVLKLRLNLCGLRGTEGYESFMNETTMLPKCETLRLRVSLQHYYHNPTSTILHLLRRCNRTRKFSIKVNSARKMYPCPLSCPCCLPESCKADGITLDSLEEVKITFIESSYEGVDFVEELARCHAPSLKRLVINSELFRDGPPAKELQEVCKMFHPDITVKFNAV